MSIDKFIRRMRKLESDIVNSNIVELAARDTVAKMGTRIFEQGQNSDNQDIGQYSTKPGVFSTKDFGLAVRSVKDDTFQPIKQPSKNNKKGYFGEFFQGGYKDFKAAIGRPNDKVNFKLTGRLQSDFLTGFIIPKQLQVNVALKNKFEIQKRKWLEERYGNVFEATDGEQENFRRVATFELNKLLP